MEPEHSDSKFRFLTKRCDFKAILGRFFCGCFSSKNDEEQMFTQEDVSANMWTSASQENLTNTIEDYILNRVYMVGEGLNRMFILVQRTDLESGEEICNFMPQETVNYTQQLAEIISIQWQDFSNVLMIGSRNYDMNSKTLSNVNIIDPVTFLKRKTMYWTDIAILDFTHKGSWKDVVENGQINKLIGEVDHIASNMILLLPMDIDIQSLSKLLHENSSYDAVATIELIYFQSKLSTICVRCGNIAKMPYEPILKIFYQSLKVQSVKNKKYLVGCMEKLGLRCVFKILTESEAQDKLKTSKSPKSSKDRIASIRYIAASYLQEQDEDYFLYSNIHTEIMNKKNIYYTPKTLQTLAGSPEGSPTKSHSDIIAEDETVYPEDTVKDFYNEPTRLDTSILTRMAIEWVTERTVETENSDSIIVFNADELKHPIIYNKFK